LSSGASSIRNVFFDVATENRHIARFAMARAALLRSANESIQFGFSYAILAQRVVIRMNFDRPQRNDLVAVENPDVFAFSPRALKPAHRGTGSHLCIQYFIDCDHVR
jgi:hypothetical protein